jgi:glyoxylase-like metal-dependent hydrolase (beta-lactamase superfamily II)
VRTVVGGLRRFSSLRVANVYLLDGGPGARWLVDCGHALERLSLLAELRATGLSPRDLTGVLLTHHHSDHAGNAAFLRERYGLRIYAHEADARTLAGEGDPLVEAAPGSSWLERAFVAVEARFPARTRVDQVLARGDEVGGLEVHEVPGHTAGSLFFRHAPTCSLLSGDTLLTAFPPLTWRSGLSLVHPAYTKDRDLALESLRAFHEAGFPYENLLAGHGRPLLGGAREQVLELVRTRTHAQ